MDTIKTWIGGVFVLSLLFKAFSCACDSTEPTKEASKFQDKFKFTQCSCWKVGVPLSGILNSLEKDSGYELSCKAVVKNNSDQTFKQLRISFHFLTVKGYVFNSYSQWSDLDNIKPGVSISFKTKKGLRAPDYNSLFKSAKCEVIDLKK
ncbi:hypothetical protein [Leptospira bandrabouensis]|uniref:Lipoprotein n=1 Tax=Leptospira bandrabouensis TaxID=2484903 RepID=A0A6H3NRT4_9LEPT|nr:hypothetical protein [Leptospira bandrabouensis]TGN11600.1 hypothetical protein EHR08_17050 [Leptospira bandrabouensis]